MGAAHSSSTLHPSITYNTPEPLLTLLTSLSISYVAYALTSSLIPRLRDDFVKIGLKGIDLLKGYKRENGRIKGPELWVLVVAAALLPKLTRAWYFIVLVGFFASPEATGMIGAGVYILLLTFFAPLPYYTHFLPPNSGSGGIVASFLPTSTSSAHSPVASVHGADLSSSGSNLDAGIVFPHHSLSTYLASLLSLLIAIFLGFLDDLFDIRWRYKLPIPSEWRGAFPCCYNCVSSRALVLPCLSSHPSHRKHPVAGRLLRRTWHHRRGDS